MLTTDIGISVSDQSLRLREYAAQHDFDIEAEDHFREATLAEKHSAAIFLTEDSCGLLLLSKSKSPTRGKRANSPSILQYRIDIDAFIKQSRSFPAAKPKALASALGRRTVSILDATAGFAGDSLLLLSCGYEVTLCERHPVLAILISDAMRRLSASEWAQHNAIASPQVIHSAAQDWLRTSQKKFDAIYFDPMFPAKRKSSAAANKFMTLLQSVVGADQDAAFAANEMSQYANRLVVKRPHYAAPLIPGPSEQYGSKLVHYDVYINHELSR